MSEEKNHEEMADEQIVEMAAVIYTGGVLGKTAVDIAKILYAKCYRKQSDDTVEVVRCKDCGHKGSAFCMAGDFPLTKENENCYCSYGARREE